MKAIGKVAVIGAGVMGAGIAAQVANGGMPVLLLDVAAKDGDSRSALAAGAIDRLLRSEPAPLMTREAAKLIEPGNVEDDLGRLVDCDWIIEAIAERLDAKRDLYRRIDAVRRPGTPVSSNTSTIPLEKLVAGMPETFARDFLITHFFNPPRYMRLLEIVAGPLSDPDLVAAVARFGEERLGKSIVACKDTPGFIANRLGVYWLQLGVITAMDLGLSVEEADAVMGRPFGIPKTGVFGLLDLVGIDLMPHVNASLASALPREDWFQAANRPLPLVEEMIATGFTGRKGKGGFYRLGRDRKDKQVRDLSSGAYRPARPPVLPDLDASGQDIRALLASDGRAGLYAWGVMGRVLAYAASLVPEAADDIVAIDDAMRLGYNWAWGPFELIDKIGAAWLARRLREDHIAVPPILETAGERPFYRASEGKRQYLTLEGAYRDLVRPEGVLLLDDIKLVSQPILRSDSAALWDLGEGVACFELTGKGNTLDEAAMSLLRGSIKTVEDRFKALVIYSEGPHFSLGANIGHALMAANIAAWAEIETLLATGQGVYKALKYANFPVVAAPAGMALGGGCELLLHCDAVQAHAETYAGLVECGVGLVPGWGGCKEMLVRWKSEAPRGPMPAPVKLFEMIGAATVSKSAAEARGMRILREQDGITMNRARLLADAKRKALALIQGYAPPPRPAPISLPGRAGKLAMDMIVEGFRKRGIATAHDVTVSGALAEILSGGDTDPTEALDEDDLLKLEREMFMRLIKTPRTLARIEHTLETGKPLRN